MQFCSSPSHPLLLLSSMYLNDCSRKEVGVVVGDWRRERLGNGRIEFLSIAVFPWLLMKTLCKAMKQAVGKRKKEVRE